MKLSKLFNALGADTMVNIRYYSSGIPLFYGFAKDFQAIPKRLVLRLEVHDDILIIEVV